MINHESPKSKPQEKSESISRARQNMNLFLMDAIFDDETLKEPTKKLLLIALAKHVNSDTGICFPGIARLARHAGCSTGHATRLIKELVNDGIIEADRRGGRLPSGEGKSSKYDFRSSKYWAIAEQLHDSAKEKEAENARIAMRGYDEKNPRIAMRAYNDETRAYGQGNARMGAENARMGAENARIAMRAKSSTNPQSEPSKQPGGVGGGDFSFSEKQKQSLSTQVTELWDSRRFPFTENMKDNLLKFQETYGISEMLAAIEILNDSDAKSGIAYLRKVLRNRAESIPVNGTGILSPVNEDDDEDNWREREIAEKVCSEVFPGIWNRRWRYAISESKIIITTVPQTNTILLSQRLSDLQELMCKRLDRPVTVVFDSFRILENFPEDVL